MARFYKAVLVRLGGGGLAPAWSGNAVEARSACFVAVGRGGQGSLDIPDV